MTERRVDLRSDTVPRPTEAMRVAMMAAPSLYPTLNGTLKNHLASRSRNTLSLLKKSPTRSSR